MDNKNKESQYLEDDQKLLDELEGSDIFNPGINNDGLNKQLQIIQIKAILRSRKNMDSFDKSTARYSSILGVFAIIQIIVALMSFILQTTSTQNKWIGFIVTITLTVIIIWILRVTSKSIN